MVWFDLMYFCGVHGTCYALDSMSLHLYLCVDAPKRALLMVAVSCMAIASIISSKYNLLLAVSA